MSNYSLFSRLSDALLHLQTTLREASEFYQSIFTKMVDGKDISRDLIGNVYSEAIQRTRHVLQEEQQRVSYMLGSYDTILSLSEIKEHLDHRISMDIVKIGKNCLKYYTEIEHHVQAINNFCGTKANEYRAFFDAIYDDKKNNHLYNDEGKVINNKQGLLIKTNA